MLYQLSYARNQPDAKHSDILRFGKREFDPEFLNDTGPPKSLGWPRDGC